MVLPTNSHRAWTCLIRTGAVAFLLFSMLFGILSITCANAAEQINKVAEKVSPDSTVIVPGELNNGHDITLGEIKQLRARDEEKVYPDSTVVIPVN